jgi:hypothetical protein
MLAFESERSLTGYDNQQAKSGGCEGPLQDGKYTGVYTEGAHLRESGQCYEVYLYDAGSGAGSGSLVCASCDPSGARPVGSAELGGDESEGRKDFIEPSELYLSRNLSENGGRLFFQTPDALVPQDSDGDAHASCGTGEYATPGCDVYEWERLGEGACTEASGSYARISGGCVFPISDVAGEHESRFMDASPDGSNVFIATQDQLVPAADADARTNVYDVREEGGFPVAASPPVCSNGDSCKPPVSSQPSIYAAPASATFSGAGNPVPAAAPPVPVPKPKPKVLTTAQKLTNALRTCKREKSKKRRAACEKKAHRTYGAAKKATRHKGDR